MNYYYKRFVSLSLVLCFSAFCVSQTEPLNADRGVSYDSESISNESVTIPLYTVNIDGASVPILLSYNTSGFKVTDIPSNVGFGWSLKAGGGIEKLRRHLIDESPNGWFFTDEFDEIQTGEFIESPTNWNEDNYYNSTVRVFDRIDSSPDMFLMRMSDGFSMDYIYGRSQDNTVGYDDIVVYKQSRDAHVFTSFYRLGNYSYNEDYEDDYYPNDDTYDVMIREGSGVNYLFRKGAKRERPWDLENRLRTEVDSTYFDNYYIHKIGTTFNDQAVSFEYVETDIKKLILHANATRRQDNSDPMTPPHPNDPFVTDDFRMDVSIQDLKRKDIKRIVSDREVVEFVYKMDTYYNNLPDVQPLSLETVAERLENQKIRLLDEIKVFDHNGNYITGYKFNYTEQTQNQSEYEGDLKIKSIIKYGKNRKHSFVYKVFDYGYFTRPSATTVAQDVFGYYNGQHGNDEENPTPLYLYNQGLSDRMPNEAHLISGMLKTVTNRNGGKTKIEYKENTFGDVYYGGLIIESITNTDAEDNLLSKVTYDYDEPEGFGLPVYNTEIDQGNGPPNAYEEGFYEPNQQMYGWQTYFTKEDKIDAQYVHYYNVSSTPYDLMRTTPVLDAYVAEMSTQYQEFFYDQLSQLSNGVIYKKVTERQINVIDNTPKKGEVVRYYEPDINGYRLGSVIQKVENYNRNGIKVNESVYNYDKEYLGYTGIFDIDNSLHADSYRYYYIDYAFVFHVKNVLRDVTKYNFDYSNGSFQNKFKQTFTYLNEGNPDQDTNYKKIKQSASYFNDQVFSKIENIYMSEFGFFNSQYDQNLQNLHYINPLIEENKWNLTNSQWLLESSVARSYLFNGSINSVSTIQKNLNNGEFFNESNFTHAYFDEEGNLITQAEDVIEFDYLEDGRIKAQKDVKNGITTIYQRSDEYDGLYVDATITTNEPYQSDSNYFIKKSFENPDNPNHVKFAKAFSGKYVFNGNSINLGNFPSGYVISFWSYENGIWVYHNQTHTGGNAIVTKPNTALYLDEVVIKPKYAVLSSYTINPLTGKTSSLNSQGDGDRVEFDLFGEPIFTYDKQGNVLTENRTNSVNININN